MNSNSSRLRTNMCSDFLHVISFMFDVLGGKNKLRAFHDDVSQCILAQRASNAEIPVLLTRISFWTSSQVVSYLRRLSCQVTAMGTAQYVWAICGTQNMLSGHHMTVTSQVRHGVSISAAIYWIYISSIGSMHTLWCINYNVPSS